MYASWGKRFLAYLIDMVIIAVPFGIGAVIDGPSIDATTGAATGGGAIYMIFALIGFLLFVYNRWIQQGSSGQTFGKKALGIKLTSEATGAPLGIGMTIVRDICHFLDSLACYIGWLFPIWDAKRQTFADKIIKSVVVPA